MTRTLTSESVLAFFWSPNGRRIAYVSRGPGEGEAELKVVSARGGASPQSLATFRPSEDMAVYVAYFNQYAYSHSLWSPDSRYLVLAGELAKQEGDGPQIMIVDATGVEPPREVAQGSLAFWAPR